ncbi:MAG: CrcB family protein [Flavobacteriales bacterium]|nr:CrcB family protein [Flavobacteriales bacterium]
MMTWLAVFVGGGLGSMARFGMGRLVLLLDVRGIFPWATLASNLISTAILAAFIIKWQDQFQGRDALKAFIAVGFCGGFSTFSTFSYENFLMLRSGLVGHAMANVVVSALAGILLFYIIARSA